MSGFPLRGQLYNTALWGRVSVPLPLIRSTWLVIMHLPCNCSAYTSHVDVFEKEDARRLSSKTNMI